MDEEVALAEGRYEYRQALRQRKAVGQEGFIYSSDRSNQEWLNTIMGSERKNAGTHSKQHIHKVPQRLRDTKDFKAYYEPREVSIGPYHNSDTKLQQEELKDRVVRQFLKISGYSEGFLDKFEWQIMKVKEYYDEDSTKDINGETFTRMMFRDGCFVLYFIYCIVTYGVENLGMKNHLIALVQQDLFLLENQLPFKVLMVLMTLSDSIPINRSIVDAFVELNATGLFTRMKHEQIQEAEPPLHLLDLLWKRLLGKPSNIIKKDSQSDQRPQKVTIKGHFFRNVKELKMVGIHLKPNKTGCLRDVNFRSYGIVGWLTLPCMTIDSSTRPMFLNLIAHEVCMDNLEGMDNLGKFGVISYLCFLGLLIDHADDVKELRNAGILDNSLGSDASVATLFSEIAGDLVPDFDTYGDVKLQIRDYYCHGPKTKMGSWVTEVFHDHFKSPWTTIAVVAGFFVIFLTAVQTYIAIYPVPDKCNESICNYLRNKTP